MMQYTTLSYWKKAAVNNSLFWVVKGIVLGLVVYFISLKVAQGYLSLPELGLFAQSLLVGNHWFLLLLPVLLVPVNWGLEGKKWQLLAAPVVHLSLGQATKAVLTGLSLGFITPRSLGDYAGRMLETGGGDRSRLVGAVLLNRISQSACTYFFGLCGLVFLLATTTLGGDSTGFWLYSLLAGGLLACLLLLGQGRKWLAMQGYRRFSKSWMKFVEVIGEYRKREILKLLLFAALRYTVYAIQFVWILKLANVPLPLPALFAGVALVFVLKSVIPTFNFLSDLGVREFSALWVFSVYAVPESQLVLASLLVWCLNILLPTLAGTYNVLCLRLAHL
jgi:uncharacterized membrane protein YbhN (UPF0104 family)